MSIFMKIDLTEKKYRIAGTIMGATSIYALLFALLPMEDGTGHSEFFHISVDLVFFSLGAHIIISVNSIINHRIACYYSWKENPIKRLLLQILLNTAFTFGFLLLMIWVYSVVVLEIICNVPTWHYLPVLRDAFIIFSVIFLFYQAVYIGVYFFREWGTSIRESEKLQQENLHSRLHALQNQTNPHFLFNSLNVLTSLIEEDQKIAVEFVKKLSDVYRYVLQRSDNHLIELRDEMKFIDSYLFLQKKRFGNNLKTEITIQPEILDSFIPPFTLQILFENAIKHNIISSDKPLIIRVYLDENSKLVIANNIQLKSSSSGSTGLGLANIESRYKILSNDDIDVVNNGSEFIVTIPLLKTRSKYEHSDY